MSRHHISVGEALAKLIKDNPVSEGAAAAKRVQSGGEAMRAFLASPEGLKLLRGLRAASEREAHEWEKMYGEPYPQTIEDWT